MITGKSKFHHKTELPVSGQVFASEYTGTVIMSSIRCHCGLPGGYDHCCGPYVTGGQFAETAEILMRSRYSAFVESEECYLRQSWHPDTRPSRVRFDPAQRWLGLSVKSTQHGTAGDKTGTVEFVARYKVAGKGHRLHEISRFEKVEGLWYYLDGQHL
jgi:SEC-C motif domain protein